MYLVFLRNEIGTLMSGNEPLVLELMDLLRVGNVITDDISLKVYECD